MAEHLSDRGVRDLEAPAAGNRITYDDAVKGFGIRVTAAGARAFVLNYRAGGRDRRITIGSFPDWKVAAARDHAAGLKRRVDSGEDPMADRHADRAAPTVDTLAERFLTEHVARKRPATQRDYGSLLRMYIRPALGKVKVAELRHSDVEKLHREVARKAPYRANRTVAVLSKMLALAVKWEMRTDNPARGIEREPEQKRERFLSPAEIARLGEALAGHPERISAAAIRLLLLTGARRGELLSATWAQFDLAAGVWTKPSAATKQKKDHRVPLSAAARAVLAELQDRADPACPYVFPSRGVPDSEGGTKWFPLTEVRRTWASVTEAAGLTGVRLHDLRHSYASILASSGLSLPIIGALLGHTQAATTARYAHLLDDPLRAATERVGVLVTGAGQAGAEVVAMRRGK